MFDQNSEGSHEVTLHRIHRPECSVYPKTSGVLRWQRDVGITFSLNFEGIQSLSGTAYQKKPQRENPGVGRLATADLTNPDWLAETDDQTPVSLYGVIQTPTSVQTSGTAGHSVACSFAGTALFAVIDIPTTRMLAFESSTLEDYRMFFSGSSGMQHHENHEVVFQDLDGSTHTSMRCSVLLAESPRISLVSSNAFVKCQRSGWLGFETPPVDSDCEIGAFAEQSFVSFLNGGKVPFHWADRKRERTIRRTYFGWVRSKSKDQDEPRHQPLPFLGGVEALSHGEDVLPCLPDLFQKYVERSQNFEFNTALHPLWTALDHRSVLQDRLALASISLERTAAYWRKCREKVLGSSPSSNNSIWKQKPLLRSIRKLLRKKLEDILFESSDNCHSLSEVEKNELSDVVKARINNITAPPNSNKLSAPFLDLQIALSPDDKEAIQKRNDALHGLPSDSSDLATRDKETEHFDRIRMLITKFVLRLCDYGGPYIDYASRPASGNFEVKRMEHLKRGEKS